jgi:hypothetical protein
MRNIEQYKKDGYLYDSLENYKDIINFDEFVKIKNFIDSKNILVNSKYDYWYKYKDLAYMEELRYDTFIKSDKDETQAIEIYQTAHSYFIKRMEECGYYPTWVFGTSCDTEIEGTFRNGVLNKFETNFVREFYPEKTYSSFNESMKLQFYNKDCEIKLHDDGKPANRVCVFLFFLNTEWDAENGGHLILHTNDESTIKINPVFPNFVVLDSDVNLFHEVEKVKNDIKYNIVSFFHHNDV